MGSKPHRIALTPRKLPQPAAHFLFRSARQIVPDNYCGALTVRQINAAAVY
jgi:hypothetical protein